MPTLPPKLGHSQGCLAFKKKQKNCQNAPKVFFKVIIQHFIRKLILHLILDLGKCPNQKTHEIRKYNSSFLIKCCIIILQIFLLETFFSQQMAFQKNGFPLVFSKSDLGGGAVFFCWNLFRKKPNTPEYAQDLVVMWTHLTNFIRKGL